MCENNVFHPENVILFFFYLDVASYNGCDLHALTLYRLLARITTNAQETKMFFDLHHSSQTCFKELEHSGDSVNDHLIPVVCAADINSLLDVPILT